MSQICEGDADTQGEFKRDVIEMEMLKKTAKSEDDRICLGTVKKVAFSKACHVASYRNSKRRVDGSHWLRRESKKGRAQEKITGMSGNGGFGHRRSPMMQPLYGSQSPPIESIINFLFVI